MVRGNSVPFLSCANVQEEATAGSAKPRRKACSTERNADGLGLGGTPTSEPEYPKRIFRLIACLRYRNKILKGTFTHAGRVIHGNFFVFKLCNFSSYEY